MTVRRGIGTDYNGVCKLISFYDDIDRPLKRTEKLVGSCPTRHTVVEYWDEDGVLALSSFQYGQAGKIPYERWLHTHWVYEEKKLPPAPPPDPKTFGERLGECWTEIKDAVKKLFNKA